MTPLTTPGSATPGSATIRPVRAAFRALVRAVVPAAASLDEAGWSRAEAIVDEALADRPSSVRRQIVLFIRLVDTMAFFRYGRTLTRLDGEKARRLLSSIERCPVLLLRRGLWGVRTLGYMGYYAQEGIQGEVGYAAAKEGWAAAGGGSGPWPERGGGGEPEATTLTVEDGANHA